jgi:hypothetical protein
MAAHASVRLRPVKSIRIRIRPVRKFSVFCRYGPVSEIQIIDVFGVPYRIRTGVAAVRGRCPGPLDEGDETVSRY